jgi:Gpi18-like mannosyltransferase
MQPIRPSLLEQPRVLAHSPSPQPLREAVRFAFWMGLSSRLIIFLIFFGLAPFLTDLTPDTPRLSSWELFGQWDGEHYEKVATQGYSFKNDGKGYLVNFFPLFPLLLRSLMQIGIDADLAGTLINNTAFFGALVVLYLWMRDRHGQSIARWSTAALAWLPFSLFGSVVYTEGLFLLFSTAALSAFDRKQYGWAMLWGSLTTACRLPGMVLVPTFAIAAFREKRGLKAAIAAIVSSSGLLLYIAYCALKFQQPIAFVLSQSRWNPKQDFFGSVWIDFFETLFLGAVNEDQGRLVDLGYPLAIALILALTSLLIWRRDRWGKWSDYGIYVLVVLFWLVGGMTAVTAAMVFGGLFMLWVVRRDINPLAWIYGLLSWAVLFASGRTISTDRYAYGSVALAIALGFLFHRAPRWGYATLIFSGILLASYSARFAQGLWAG